MVFGVGSERSAKRIGVQEEKMNATAAREYASKHTRVSKREKEKIKGGETISQKIENNLGRQRTGLSRAMGTGFGGEEGKEARRRGTKTWVGETRSWCVCVWCVW